MHVKHGGVLVMVSVYSSNKTPFAGVWAQNAGLAFAPGWAYIMNFTVRL